MEKDLFSQQAAIYARFRPGYPPELYEYILSFTERRDKAWDAGTGNGQAAVALGQFFNHVIATDLSEKQLEQAQPSPNVEYRVSPADKTIISAGSIDLITVAQAYHWFPFSAFEKEVKRVGSEHAIIAVWCYGLPVIHDPLLNSELIHFYSQVTGPYWDPERKYVDNMYADIPFPYELVSRKEFQIQYQWTIHQLAGYTGSWSAVQHYRKANGIDPVTEFQERLHRNEPDSKTFTLEFPIVLLLGKVFS